MVHPSLSGFDEASDLRRLLRTRQESQELICPAAAERIVRAFDALALALVHVRHCPDCRHGKTCVAGFRIERERVEATEASHLDIFNLRERKSHERHH
jgi:hypothetical protein